MPGPVRRWRRTAQARGKCPTHQSHVIDRLCVQSAHQKLDPGYRTWHRLPAGLQFSSQLLDLPHHQLTQQRLLRREVIEKSALGDIGSVGDLFDGGGCVALTAKESQGGLQQPLARFQFLSFPAG